MHIVMLRDAIVSFAPVRKGTILDLPDEEAGKVLEAGDARLRDEPEPEGEPKPPQGGPGPSHGVGNTAGPPGGDGTGNTAGAPGTTGTA